MKPSLLFTLLIFFAACATVYKNNQHLQKSNFKVIGYLPGRSVDTSKIPFQYLTHINFAFAIPMKDSGYLQALARPEKLKELVQASHRHNVEVFLSIGGWG